MKKNIVLIFVLISSICLAQAPHAINYQAVARNAVGSILTSPISVRFDVYQGSVGGTLVYQESHNVNPSSNGIFTVNIGKGTVISGVFSSINWSVGPYFIQTAIDPNGGTAYNVIGSNQLVSVPYALYAEKAGNQINYLPGVNVSLSGLAPNLTVNATPTLNFASNVLSISGGNSVTLPTGITYTSGNGIAINSGSIIVNTFSSTSVSSGSNINVVGTIPNYTVSSPAYSINLSPTADSLVLTNGMSVSSLKIPGQSLAYSTSSLSTTGFGTLTLGSQSIQMSNWDMFGNNSTNSITHFLGTTDAQSLIFRTNNMNRMAINTNSINGNGGVVIGGNVLNTSLGKALTLQGTLSDPSDQMYGHLALRGGGVTANVPQAFMTFNNSLGARLGLLGDFNNTDDDIHLLSGKGLRLGAGNTYTNTHLFIEGSNGKVGVGTGTMIPTFRLHVSESFLPIPTIGAINSYTSVSIATYGLYAEAANVNSNSAAVYGTHSGGGRGVTGMNTNSVNPITVGVYGVTSGSNTGNVSIQADIINGNSTGILANGFSGHTGIAIHAIKAGPAGIAGRFEISNSSNSSSSIMGITYGAGAALHAFNGPASTSALSLLIENGHIKSKAVNPPTHFSVTAIGGFTQIGTPTINGTDVNGQISFNASGAAFAGINFYDVQFNFQKAYSNVPTVILTPITDFKGLSFMVSNTTLSSFVVRIYKPNGALIPNTLSNDLFKFNYFIIE